MREILLLEAKDDEARRLAAQLQQFGYTLHRCGSIAHVRERVQSGSPMAIVAALPEGDNACETIESVGKIHREYAGAPPIVFLSSDPQMAIRLAAVRAGARALLARPFSTIDLVDTLDPLCTDKGLEPFRVLIVDDDPRICRYYQIILDEAGMETLICNKPLQAFQALADFRPELIIMDLYMPECRGKELATVIRQNPSYDSIPIVFLSSEDDILKQLDVMNIGGDDFLTKPIRPEHLVMAVLARARRFRSLRSLMTRDSLTGLLNHTATREHLEIEIARMAREKRPLAFAIIDLDHFKQINDTYGHPAGDRVIKTLAGLLKQRLRTTDLIGRTGGEEFAVGLTGADAAQAVHILNDIRESFALIRQQYEGGEFTVTLSCGIAMFPEFANVSALTDAADRALYQAKNAGRNQVVLAGR